MDSFIGRIVSYSIPLIESVRLFSDIILLHLRNLYKGGVKLALSEEFFKASEELRKTFEDIQRRDEEDAESFWNGLSYDDKCNAFHAVVKRLVQGDIKDKGSYRYVLYDVFGFDADMYVRGMNCGYMTLHNSIFDGMEAAEAEVKDGGRDEQSNG